MSRSRKQCFALYFLAGDQKTHAFALMWGGVRQQSVATLFMSRHLILVFLKVEAFKCSIVFNIFRADE